MQRARIVFAGALLFGVGCELSGEGAPATDQRIDPIDLDDSIDYGIEANVTVSIQAHAGHYLVAEGGGGGDLHANRLQASTWETFTIIDLDGGALMSRDSVCIETWHRYYVVAEGGGGREARANRDRCLSWETFRIIKINWEGWPVEGEIEIPGRVAFQSINGHYLVAEGGGGGDVNANRGWIGAWEIFTLNYK